MNSNSLFHSEEAVIKDRFFNLDWIDTAKKTERTISGFSELKPQKKEEPSGSSKQLILPSALWLPGRDQPLLPGTCQSTELPRSPQNQVHQAQTTGGHLLSPYQISFPENPPCLE